MFGPWQRTIAMVMNSMNFVGKGKGKKERLKIISDLWFNDTNRMRPTLENWVHGGKLNDKSRSSGIQLTSFQVQFFWLS